jgi:molybdenum cofactor cytidylyltransferase
MSLSRHCTAVVLAAGTGSRFGGQKLLAGVNGQPMIAQVLAAVAHLPTVVVGSPELRAHVSGATFVENAAPERGMAHSLRLAYERVDRSHGLLVLLADMPFMTRAVVDAVVNGIGDAAVCYPQRAGIGGHPVLFSSQARTKIAALPDGDTLRSLRDDPTLTHIAIHIADDGAYRDVDRMSDL